MQKNLILVGFITLGLAACGGGGGGSSSSSNNNNDDTKTVHYIGQADGIDSANNQITISGVTYSLASNVEIELDGAPDRYENLSLSDLTTDMELDIELKRGTSNTISEIEVEADVIGIAENVTASSLTVNGQTFNHDLSSAINEGDSVILTGFIDTDSSFVVNSLSRFETTGNFVLHYGKIENLDTSMRNFDFVNGASVDFSIADIDSDDIRELQNGGLVEVEGSSYANGEILANDLDMEDDYNLSSNTQLIEVEGKITEVGVDKSWFIVNNLWTVNVTETTIFEKDDGITFSADDLVVGKRIEVEMTANGNEFDAVEIDFD